jgi:hypothetical protein
MAIVAAICACVLLLGYGLCVVSGRADREHERWMSELRKRGL